MTAIDDLLDLPDVRRLRAGLAARPGIGIDASDDAIDRRLLILDLLL